nr:hypothetical protein [uncultured Acetatifactor sp.]
MESKHSMGNITLEEGYAETKLADSETGYKMSIPVCNAVIPPCWRDTVLKVAEAFMYTYDTFYGRTPEDIYVDGNLTVCLDRGVPNARKYWLYIVIVAEEGGTEQDYRIEIPILPGYRHFEEVRQCFLSEFQAMLGIGQEAVDERE